MTVWAARIATTLITLATFAGTILILVYAEGPAKLSAIATGALLALFGYMLVQDVRKLLEEKSS